MTATHYADSDKNLWSSEAEQINAAATSQQGPLKINQTQKRILFAEQTVMFIFRRISLIFAFYCTISVWKTVRPLKTVQMNQSDDLSAHRCVKHLGRGCEKLLNSKAGLAILLIFNT